jgi:hypothetical protein
LLKIEPPTSALFLNMTLQVGRGTIPYFQDMRIVDQLIYLGRKLMECG